MTGFEKRDSEQAAARHALVGPADLWEMKRRFQIEFLRRAGLEPGHRLLDLGCGTLRGGVPIIDYLLPGHYFGVESREEVLAEAYQELDECGLVHKWPQLVHCTDLGMLKLRHKFDFVWAFAVLIHMDDAVLDLAVDAVARHLREAGVFYATVNIGNEPDGKWKGFPVVYRRFEFYEQTFNLHQLKVTDLGPLNTFGHVHPRLAPEAQAQQRMLIASRT